MASLKGQKALIPQMMRVDGNAVCITDKYVLTATNPAAADTIDFLIPAGAQVCDLSLQIDDISAAADVVFGVGYRAVNTASALVASTTYFAAAGQTTGQAGGRLNCAFKPIKFEEDVYIQIVIGTAGTGTNTGQEIHMIATVNQLGPK
jgi:hypothetical protein